MAGERVGKVCPVVLRDAGPGHDILVFHHPLAGMQLVKGTIEPGEAVAAAALRELAEESGVTGARAAELLGGSETIADGQPWYFVRCISGELPETWTHHTDDDGGHDFSFSWWRLASTPEAALWHPVFVRALTHIRNALADPR